nr:hypothetical protein [Croceibacter atlanticus]
MKTGWSQSVPAEFILYAVCVPCLQAGPGIKEQFTEILQGVGASMYPFTTAEFGFSTVVAKALAIAKANTIAGKSHFFCIVFIIKKLN